MVNNNDGKVLVRYDTSENWLRVNPVLARGEVGVENDTNTLKVGDGITPWEDLQGISGGGGSGGVHQIVSELPSIDDASEGVVYFLEDGIGETEKSALEVRIENVENRIEDVSDFVNSQSVTDNKNNINSTYVSLPEYGSIQYATCGKLVGIQIKDLTVKAVSNGEYIIATGFPIPLIWSTFFLMSQDHSNKIRVTVRENNGEGVLVLDWNGNISSNITSLTGYITYIKRN